LFVRASVMRSARFWVIAIRRLRCAGDTRSIGHRMSR
jgi:hypothetical protein